MGCGASKPSADVERPPPDQIEQHPLPVKQQEELQQPEKQPDVVKAEVSAPDKPEGIDRGNDWSKSWSKLNQTETTAVKQTLLKVRRAVPL